MTLLLMTHLTAAASKLLPEVGWGPSCLRTQNPKSFFLSGISRLHRVLDHNDDRNRDNSAFVLTRTDAKATANRAHHLGTVASSPSMPIRDLRLVIDLRLGKLIFATKLHRDPDSRDLRLQSGSFVVVDKLGGPQ